MKGFLYMKKIIVFGASGDTGKYFVDYLLNTVHTDFEIIASGTKDCRYYEHNNIKYIKVDITQKKAAAPFVTSQGSTSASSLFFTRRSTVPSRWNKSV